MSELEGKKSSPKYLVVDDEIIRDSDKKDFIGSFNFPLEAGIFVQNYEEAVNALKANSNIILSFIDLRIPLNNRDLYEKETEKLKNETQVLQEKLDLNNENGCRVLQKIRDLQLKNIKVYLYSAYEKERVLRLVTNQYNDVVSECFQKPNIPKHIQEKIYPLSQLFEQKLEWSNKLSFDYSFLDYETLSFVQSKTNEIKKLAKKAAEDIINIGIYIIEVREKLGYGYFYKWLEAEFAWSPSTAIRFVNVAEKFRSVSLTDLDIYPSALYQLAGPTVPDSAVEEALARAREGENITEKLAKDIKNKHKKLEMKDRSQEEQRFLANSEGNIQNVCIPTPSLALTNTNKQKQQIVAIYPSDKAVKNTWWQLGKRHQLFCGKPKSPDFVKRLPEKVSLTISFLPTQYSSRIPYIKAVSSLSFYSEYSDLDLDWLLILVKKYMETSTQSNDIVVFNYFPYAELIELTQELDCDCYVAESDLVKCNQLLTRWREKENVTRIRH